MKNLIALQSPHENQVITTRATAEKNNWWITYEVEAIPEHDEQPHPENVNKVPRVGMLLKGVNGGVYKIKNLTALEICFACEIKATHRIGKKFYCLNHYNKLVITKPIKRTIAKQHRNALCNCGSGKKFKHCCALNADNKPHHFYNSDYNRNQQSA